MNYLLTACMLLFIASCRGIEATAASVWHRAVNRYLAVDELSIFTPPFRWYQLPDNHKQVKRQKINLPSSQIQCSGIGMYHSNIGQRLTYHEKPWFCSDFSYSIKI